MFRPEDLRDELIAHNQDTSRRVPPPTGVDVEAKIADIKARGVVGKVTGTILQEIYNIRRVMWVPPKG